MPKKKLFSAMFVVSPIVRNVRISCMKENVKSSRMSQNNWVNLQKPVYKVKTQQTYKLTWRQIKWQSVSTQNAVWW